MGWTMGKNNSKGSTDALALAMKRAFKEAVEEGVAPLGEILEQTKPTVPAHAAGGRVGGRRRAERLSANRRSEIAKVAAKSRWGQS